MIVETFNSEVVEQSALGVMLKKNFTKPVYQKIGRVRALNFNPNFVNWLDRCRVRNEVRQRTRSILKHLRKNGAECFKPNVGGVLQNAKARHSVMGIRADRKVIPASIRQARRRCLQPISYHTGDAPDCGGNCDVQRFREETCAS